MDAHPTETAGPEWLASALMEKGALTSEWLPAFNAAPRHLFIPDVIWPGRAGMNRQDDRVIRSEEPEVWWSAVYRDAPITTQWDDGNYTGPGKGKIPSSSSSMPTMVFSMLDALGVEDGHRVLEIGTGTGWNAALLSHRLGSDNVFTIEVDETSARDARKRLNDAGFHPVSVIGDGAEGYPDGAPYDRVIATASVGRVPRQWVAQTKPGGIIVTPWGPTYGGEGIVRLTVADSESAVGPFVGSSAFMRLRAQRTTRKHVREYLEGRKWPADGRRTMTDLSPESVGDWPVMFAIGVQVPEAFPWMEPYDDGSYTLWLRDTAVTSWATVDFVPGHEEFEVYQSGPRNLWDEVVAAYLWWDEQKRPGFERFGLTVDGNRERVWLDRPDNPVPVVARP
ncbi:methyltransferase domain-containing protein [Allostreptomyces psammosilenae]|uniref:Protein-L-isoaspartate O-methyltransferase n=1 Tax=Allostreptomyces psammosilenae TaxID=1892865 RepID=A0A853A8F9_9ACTN|nr:methyltransferase domain-containing protein [Allostreptomyces psammosilenae]NYI06818.1 protein-L-isoaspartate(D-aspartate) O-methyltransferase [Allostreptomyces psammosilenae]